MRINDKDINSDEYLLIHISEKYQINSKTDKNENNGTYRKVTYNISASNEVTDKHILELNDIIKFDYIFHIALEREMLKMITKEIEIELQKKFIDYIKERSFEEKITCISKMNNLISSIHIENDDLAIVKKYLILYYFSNKLNKRTIEAKLRKLHVKLKHY